PAAGGPAGAVPAADRPTAGPGGAAVPAGAPQVAAVAAETPPLGLRTVLRRVWRDRNGRRGGLFTSVLLLVAVLALVGLTPYDPLAQEASERLQGPSGGHWFGTDQFGRDVASRTAVGIAASLRVAVVAVAVAAVLGTLLGVTAGFFGGPV